MGTSAKDLAQALTPAYHSSMQPVSLDLKPIVDALTPGKRNLGAIGSGALSGTVQNITSNLVPAMVSSARRVFSGDGGGGGGYGYGYSSGPSQQQKDTAEQTKVLYKEGANTTYNTAIDNFKSLNAQWDLNDAMAKNQRTTADLAADREMFSQEKKQQSMTQRMLNGLQSAGSIFDTFTQANKRFNDMWKSELKGNLMDNWNSIENNRLAANSNIWQQMENLSSETKAKLKGYGIDLAGAISNIHSDLAKGYYSGNNLNWNASDLKYINDLVAKMDQQRRAQPTANYQWYFNPAGPNETKSGGNVLNAMGRNINPEFQQKQSVGYDNRKALGE